MIKLIKLVIGDFLKSKIFKNIIKILVAIVIFWALSFPSFYILTNVYPNIPIVNELTVIKSLENLTLFAMFEASFSSPIAFILISLIGLIMTFVVFLPFFVIFFVIFFILLLLIVFLDCVFNIPGKFYNLKKSWKEYKDDLKERLK